MIIRKLSRFRLETVLFQNHRKYSNRNVLKLRERGLIEDLFPNTPVAVHEAIDLLVGKPQTVYAGFDPTAESLHIGNLLIICSLIHWQRAGHFPIALLGGATAQIGDPSGKTKDRDEAALYILEENTDGIKRNIQTVFANHEKYFWEKKAKAERLQPLQIVNNSKWYESMNVVDFIGHVGRQFRMGTMLRRESVQTRLDSEVGMSFTEFTYQIFQAYDWLHLYRKYNCRFQIGGSDQMGNIVSGHHLIDRFEKASVFGVTVPLVKTTHGDKLGKTAGNAVWLNPKMSSPFEMYQHFARTTDNDVEILLKCFTFNSDAEIDAIVREHKNTPSKRTAQKKLAEDVTLLVHGEAGLKSALEATEALYSGTIESLSRLSADDVTRIFKDATVKEIFLKPGITVLDLSLEIPCFKSQGDAIRKIEAGGLHLNHQRITNFNEIITPSIHILPNKLSLIRSGKKNYYIVKWIL